MFQRGDINGNLKRFLLPGETRFGTKLIMVGHFHHSLNSIAFNRLISDPLCQSVTCFASDSLSID